MGWARECTNIVWTHWCGATSACSSLITQVFFEGGLSADKCFILSRRAGPGYRCQQKRDLISHFLLSDTLGAAASLCILMSHPVCARCAAHPGLWKATSDSVLQTWASPCTCELQLEFIGNHRTPPFKKNLAFQGSPLILQFEFIGNH